MNDHHTTKADQPRLMTDAELDEAAQVGADAYEWACEWRKAGQNVREHIREELGLCPTDRQVATAVRRAQVIWEARKMAVKRAVQDRPNRPNS